MHNTAETKKLKQKSQCNIYIYMRIYHLSIVKPGDVSISNKKFGMHNTATPRSRG